MTIIIGSLARVTSQLKVGSFLVQSGLVSPSYFLPLLRHAGGPHLIRLHKEGNPFIKPRLPASLKH